MERCDFVRRDDVVEPVTALNKKGEAFLTFIAQSCFAGWRVFTGPHVIVAGDHFGEAAAVIIDFHHAAGLERAHVVRAGRDIDVQLGAFAGLQYFLQHDVRRMRRTHEAKILIRIYRPNGRRGMKAEFNIG